MERTLEVEVTHVATGVSKVMPLSAVFGEPGLYRGPLMPTASGQYRFRFLGKIEGEGFDETFESGPGNFDDVEPQVSIDFPVNGRD